MHNKHATAWKWWCGTAFFFSFSAFLITIDEWNSPYTVALKSTQVTTVPMFNAWTIGWNADRALHGFRGYWDAPIFHPETGTFAFSEPQPATLLVAPVVWATGSAIQAYKAWWWLSLTLNGVAAAWLFRCLELKWPAQISGGVAIQLLPIGLQRPDVLQLIPVWGILWFWGSLYVFQQKPTLTNSLCLGISFASSFALCIHHALFLSLVTLVGALAFVPRMLERRFLIGSLLSMSVAMLCILPIVIPMHHISQNYGFERNERALLSLAAEPEDYLAPPSGTLLDWEPFEGQHRRQLNPGWLRMMFGIAGIALGLISAGNRRWTLFLLFSAIAAYLLSLGGHLSFGDWTAWHFLRAYVPGFRQVRSIYRFGWIVQMTIILFAVVLLGKLWNKLGGSNMKLVPRTAASLLLSAMSLWLAVEVLPSPVTRGGVPDESKHKLWTTYIRENTPPGKTIVCFPFSTGRQVEDFDMTARWMLLGLKHKVPMINGYSGFFPASYRSLKSKVTEHSLSNRLLPLLAKRNVHFVVVADLFMSNEQVQRIPTIDIELEHVFSDPIGINVYLLRMSTPRL